MDHLAFTAPSSAMHSRAATPPRSTRWLILAFVAALSVITAGIASADAIFTVTLTNGTSLLTRYRPVVAEWDESVALIRTDQGNWIAIAKDEIADVASKAETSGFGYQLDTTTLFLGWSPNDLIDDSAADGDGEGTADGEGGGGGGGDSESRPYYEDDALYDSPAASGGDFSLEQFVDVPTEGESVGGIELAPAVNSGQ